MKEQIIMLREMENFIYVIMLFLIKMVEVKKEAIYLKKFYTGIK